MVTVIAMQDFPYRGVLIYAGQPVEMEPIDALVENRKGNVCLEKIQPFYNTRHLEAIPDAQRQVVHQIVEEAQDEGSNTSVVIVVPVQTVEAPRRRRGRPRKKAR